MISCLLFALSMQTPIKVELKQVGSNWQMLRGGKPYFVKGVGGTGQMDELVQSGGNSMRTWGSEKAASELDECHKRGLTLMLGIWLGHRSYFNYSNPEQIEKQKEQVRADIRKHRNHPALLMYGLGNEMEVDNNDTPTLWREINELAKIVHAEDPNHLAATVVADISPEKIARIKQYAPDIDVLGINSYGGLATLPERLKAAGWTKPYVVTEFGPNGPWEMKKTAWGAALEPTSAEKADKYFRDYQHSIAGNAAQCVGSYAFLWGNKQEETHTWFGMFLPSGERTQAVDVMIKAWTGKSAKNSAPILSGFTFNKAGLEFPAGEDLVATASVTDPDSDPLIYKWEVRLEGDVKGYAGEGEKLPPVRPGDWDSVRTKTLNVKGPTRPGRYRLFVYVMDGKGNAAVANSPFLVK